LEDGGNRKYGYTVFLSTFILFWSVFNSCRQINPMGLNGAAEEAAED
jgi:hypothetical protein